jgi:hypothetical protein
MLDRQGKCSTELQLDYFHQESELKFNEEISKQLSLEHSFVWCWNLDISDSR